MEFKIFSISLSLSSLVLIDDCVFSRESSVSNFLSCLSSLSRICLSVSFIESLSSLVGDNSQNSLFCHDREIQNGREWSFAVW